ncbi:MAG: hypothetical protein Q4C85_00935 [Actinomyces sp.]|uniref:hypothetical protein n=1 Tax=Actinomyces sp. TaxID=29317 RepID=UPI0026DD4663|nr:hypothetical protein [Actinomyces sp.]MDO4242327.1 hypothetical protein [Actinomyces sp.]
MRPLHLLVSVLGVVVLVIALAAHRRRDILALRVSRPSGHEAQRPAPTAAATRA